MPCADLALTGSGPVLLTLLLAAVAVVLGVILLLRGRRRVVPGLGALLILGLVVGGVLGTASPAQAACSTADANSLAITQTSTIEGLMPGRAPEAITGIVVNTGTDSMAVTAITVSIASVTSAPGAAAGTCGAGDFIVLDPRMAVGGVLAPGASAAFGGASIGFLSTGANQDACKNATVSLLYSTTP